MYQKAVAEFEEFSKKKKLDLSTEVSVDGAMIKFFAFKLANTTTRALSRQL